MTLKEKVYQWIKLRMEMTKLQIQEGSIRSSIENDSSIAPGEFVTVHPLDETKTLWILKVAPFQGDEDGYAVFLNPAQELPDK